MQNEVLIITASAAAQSVLAGLKRKEVSEAKKAFLMACVQTHKQVAYSQS
ncbi:hypothetical protein J7E73_22540 [Paenibacillus albidus]|nr:hypothetical protein [Paenibacillus albidus]MBT2291852.1 hypothetical protein [Paenibacillus albidus]